MNTNIKLITKFIYGFILEEGKIISTILTINAPIKIVTIHVFILSNKLSPILPKLHL